MRNPKRVKYVSSPAARSVRTTVETLTTLVDQQVDTFRQRFTGLKVVERKNSTVNGAKACRVVVTGDSQQGALKVATEVLLRDERIFLFILMLPAQLSSGALKEFDRMINSVEIRI